MKDSLRIILIFLCFLVSCGHASDKKSGFEFRHNGQGFELYEAGKYVFFYQKEPKKLQGQYVCCDYLHPLFSTDGDTLTEESPADHPYHRGVYWAWHQIFIDGKSVGDGWVMQDIMQEVYSVKTEVKNTSAALASEVFWKSALWNNNQPFIKEKTLITVYPVDADVRIIDFEIRLRALAANVSIGGSDDEKGYGGFCIRLKLPGDILFTSENGPVTPEVTQIKAGPWMDFSGSFGTNGKNTGVTLICDPDTPNFPAPWILRKESSMQNIVYPGRQRVELSAEKDLVLKYRILVHSGELNSVGIEKYRTKNQQ